MRTRAMLWAALLLQARSTQEREPVGSRPATMASASRPTEWTPAEAHAALDDLEKTLQRPLRDPGSGLSAQRQLVAAFLARCPLRDATRAYRLTARARIAGICLFAFELACAEEHFRAMLEEAEGPADEEFRHRSLYGLGQVAEMRGDLREAGQRYRALYEDRTQSRYTSFALTALKQLEARTTLGRGDIVPRLASSRMDLDGGVAPLARLQEKILVLLFWAPGSQPSRKALADARKTLAPFSSDPSVAVVTVALDPRRDDVDRARRDEAITWPVLWDNSGWMDPLALQFGVRTLPASVLIGPGSRFVAADLPLAEMASAIATLLGK